MAAIPNPLSSTLIPLQRITKGIPPRVHVTSWGSPLASSQHVVFYFDGMPTSAQEPALHSVAAGSNDIYRAKNIHLLCLDKPGMGRTPSSYWFSITRDWQLMVHQVAEHWGISEYAIMGVSNGGPYVMACLQSNQSCVAGVMIVAVSNVRVRYVHRMDACIIFARS